MHRTWDELVEKGYITDDELHESLLDQVTGSIDMSADELDDAMCTLMGWNPSAVTEDQYRIWKGIVNQAADEYMRR